MNNNRKHQRQRAASVAAHVRMDNRIAMCRVEDISESGVFIRTDESLPLGLAVSVDLARPGLKKALRLTGKVVRRTSQGKVGIGVHFDTPDSETRARLVQLLADLGGDKYRPIEAPASRRYEPIDLPPLEPASAPDPAPAPAASAGAGPQTVVTAQLAGSAPDQARLIIQVKGLLMELGTRDDALARKDREIAALNAQIEELQAEAKALRAGIALAEGEASDPTELRREAQAARQHLDALLALLGKR